jgi:hypothetical protein
MAIGTVRVRLHGAEECKRLGETARIESSLARSYEFAERLSNFMMPFRKKNKRKVGGRNALSRLE